MSERSIDYSHYAGILFSCCVNIVRDNGIVINAVPFTQPVNVFPVKNFNFPGKYIDELLSFMR